MKTFIHFVLLSMIVFASCSDDKDSDLSIKEKDWDNLIVTAIPNPDGLTGSNYMQLIGDLSPSSYDNSRAIPTPFMALPYLDGNDVYILPAWDSQQEVVKYRLEKGSGLQKKGSLPVPPSSGATSVAVKNADKAYMALAFLGKILIFNPTTMKQTGEIDITSYGLDDKNPDPGAMIIRDDILYIGLNQMIGGYTPKYKSVDVLLIDTRTDQVIKLIRDKESGMSSATRPIDQRSIFMDEQKDVYIVCYAGFGLVEGHKSGILRIKANETEFDKSFIWDLTNETIKGETNSMDWLHWVQYAGNGKLYGIANIPAYHSNPRDYVKDRTAIAVELDLYNKTIETIDLPRSTAWSGIGIHNGILVFGLYADKSGYYTYDPRTKIGSAEPVIDIVGTPQMFRHFGEKY